MTANGTEPEALRLEVDGQVLTSILRRAPEGGGTTLVVALHGGTYTSRYFEVAAPGGHGFLAQAAARGFSAVAIDRPGYGGSAAIPPAENTFARQAALLREAIASLVAELDASGVFLVGHSIGGMIGLDVAGGAGEFWLLGASLTGMGAVMRADGPARAMGEAAFASELEVVDLPNELRDPVMFGPDWTYTPELLAAAHLTYAPAPVCELAEPPRWPGEHLEEVASAVAVPVQYVVGEFDAIWDSSTAAIGSFVDALGAAPLVDSGVARATGHSIDHHILGPALHARQLAFAEECELLATRG